MNYFGLFFPNNFVFQPGWFENVLFDVPSYSSETVIIQKDLPTFVIKIIEKIESKINTVGLYRVNGDAAEVQQIR